MHGREDQGSSRAPLDLEQAIAIARRRATLILLCVFVTAAAAFGLSLIQHKQYSASATLLFRNPGFAEDLFGTSATPPSTDPVREAATNRTLVGLDAVGQRAARHLRGLDAEEVSDMVSVSGEGEADVVSVTATNGNPTLAKRVANVFARQFIAFRAGTDRSKLLKAKRLAERELERLTPEEEVGARGQALSRGAERLGILASLQTGNAELVQPAELPTSPSSPKPVRNGIIGAIIGLVLGAALAFLFERLNRRLRDPEEARKAFELPVLGTVPESKAIVASNEGPVATELPFGENEAFRMMRASLRYFNVDRDMRSVMVTSHGVSDGKSTVAWNLARVAASSSKVIIVETDLRNPSLGRQHGLAPGPGLAQLLTHQVKLDAAIQTKPLPSPANGTSDGERGLDVMVCGAIPPNPAELIESQTMRDVLSQLTERYELVVIDTAPLGVVSDAFPLLRAADGVIVVTRMGKSTRDGAVWLREQLDRLDAPVLGIVANGIKRKRVDGYGRYGGYYGPPAGESPKPAEAGVPTADV
ncbi:MAG TPA: polysaccharide biosynthesis tyrosine autokinase [Solirubrobacterales bacterium]|nr:polysaccharide biosynthesis tyrosine autokinase [Solirubrobacterales bacterium]